MKAFELWTMCNLLERGVCFSLHMRLQWMVSLRKHEDGSGLQSIRSILMRWFRTKCCVSFMAAAATNSIALKSPLVNS